MFDAVEQNNAHNGKSTKHVSNIDAGVYLDLVNHDFFCFFDGFSFVLLLLC